jgi:hypothetical protein
MAKPLIRQINFGRFSGQFSAPHASPWVHTRRNEQTSSGQYIRPKRKLALLFGLNLLSREGHSQKAVFLHWICGPLICHQTLQIGVYA